MNKRGFLAGAAVLGAMASPAFGARRVRTQACAASPVLLTVSGSIKSHNRGALDPAFDRLLARHQVKFAQAYGADLPLLASMKTVTIRPTLEYDSRQHTLSGPLLTDVLDHIGAPSSADTQT
jgi:hypothetical protein